MARSYVILKEAAATVVRFACSRKERKTKACLTRWFNTCKYQQDLRIHAEAMHSRAIMKTSFRFWRLLAAQIIRKRLSENNVACVVRDRHRLAVMKRTFYDWIDAVEAIGKERRAKAHWRLRTTERTYFALKKLLDDQENIALRQCINTRLFYVRMIL